MAVNKIGKYISGYSKQLFSSFKEDLLKVNDGYNKEDIHSLRLNIKKIKALYCLLEAIFPDNFNRKKCYAHFSKIFKYAGEMREAQVNMESIYQYQLPSSAVAVLKDSLLNKERSSKELLKRSIRGFDFNALQDIRADVKGFCRKLTQLEFNKRSNKYIKKEYKKIEELREMYLSNVTVHRIRKHLKKLGSFTKLLYKRESVYSLKEFMSVLKETEKMIGEWHDKVVLRNALQRIHRSNSHFSPQNMEAIQKVIEKLHNQNNILLAKLTVRIDETLESAGKVKLK